jgi:uncharacterized membrane protein YdbT with pleckstrin-like domain
MLVFLLKTPTNGNINTDLFPKYKIMMETNTQQKLPGILKWYVLTILILFSLLFSAPFALQNNNAWRSIFITLFIFIVLPIWIYMTIQYKFISFTLDKNTLTKNYGILIKQSKSITFDKIQNVNIVKGLISGLFGLSEINIWTASPSQIGTNKNGKVENKPDCTLLLKSEDTEWLKNYVLQKNSI